MLGLRFSARALFSCGERGPLFIAVRRPLTIAASLVAEHRLQTCRLSSCGSRAQFVHGMWDLPRPGLEPVSPAPAGRPSTTSPPGKPPKDMFLITMLVYSRWAIVFWMWGREGGKRINPDLSDAGARLCLLYLNLEGWGGASQEKKAGMDRALEVSWVACDSTLLSTYYVCVPGQIPALLELII